MLNLMMITTAASGGSGAGYFTHCVDSVNGNDANSGLTALTAKQTLAAAQALLSGGESLGLARGSHWREQFNIPAHNIRFGVYGSGAMPIIDGADIATGWTEHADGGSFPDVWQVAWTRSSATTTGSEYLGLWADGVRPRAASSLADLQANGGWFPLSFTTQSTTVYIKSVADPNTSGVVYEITKRHYAFNGHTTTLGSTMTSQRYNGPIELTRCVGHYNTLSQGHGVARQLFLLEGNIHHSVSEGSQTDIVMTEYNPSLALGMVAYYRPVSAGFAPNPKRNLFLQAGGANRNPFTGSGAIYAHGSSGLIDSLTIEECMSRGVNFASADSTLLISRNGYCEDVTNVAFSFGAGQTATIDRHLSRETTISPVNSNNSTFFTNNAATVTARNCGSYILRGGAVNQANTTFQHTYAHCAFVVPSSIPFSGGGPNITYTICHGGRSYNTFITGYVGNYNVFYFVNQAAPQFVYNGVTHGSLAAFQAASGQDASSVFLKHADQVSGNGIAFWLGVSSGLNSGPVDGDFRVNPSARVYNGAGATLSGVFADGVTPITMAGIQEHWDYISREVVSGPPTRWPTLPSTIAEMRTYVEAPEEWDFYPATASLTINFTTDAATLAGVSTPISSLLATARAAAAYYTKADGTLESFSSDVLRYDDNGLLRENAATNLFQRSQEFANAYWTKNLSTATDNATNAPDGTATAAKLAASASSGNHFFGRTVTISNATRYVYSLYVKAAEYSKLRVHFSGLNNLEVVYDFVNGSIITLLSGTSPVIEREVLANGWYRISFSDISTLTSTGTNIFLVNDDNSFNFLGDGTSGFYQWGAQIELGTYPTSYIPTTTAAATRPADIITFSDLTWFDGTNTSIVAEWVATNVNDAVIWAFDATNDKALVEKTGMSPSIAGAVVGNTVARGTRIKAAARMAVNDFAIAMNAGTIATDTSETAPGTLAASRLGCDLAGANGFNGYIKSLTAYKATLRDEQLGWLSSAPVEIYGDLRDYGAKAVQTTGSISAASATLTVADASDIRFGDRIIVEIGGEAGLGQRGTMGVGGSWPRLSYANAAAMNADATQAANTYAWLLDTGNLYRFVAGVWTQITTNYYLSKGLPKSLVSTVYGVSGNTITLKDTATVDATNANVYVDNTQYFNVARDKNPGSALGFPSGEFAVANSLELVSSRFAGTEIYGASETLTRIKLPKGLAVRNIGLNTASTIINIRTGVTSAIVRDLTLVGNSRNQGYMLNASEIDAPAASIYNGGVFFLSAAHNGVMRRVTVEDVFSYALGAQDSTNVWAYDCDVVIEDPLLVYVQWMYEWVASSGGVQDCSIDSNYLLAGMESFNSSGPLRFVRPVLRNAAFSFNNAGNWTIEDPVITVEANSQFSPAFHESGPIININSNFGTSNVSGGGVITNPIIVQEGYINAANDSLQAIVVNLTNPNITINGGTITAPDYLAPSARFGAVGLLSVGPSTDVTGLTVIGLPRPGSANIRVDNGSITNCTATVIDGP
jgi:hypothetical protein